jgi:DNA-binding transcriptional ArsR family regulator
MQWELLGYKDYPFSIHPIEMDTLELFTGHHKEIQICQNILDDNNVRIVIEGARGVGTTSFANFLKFSCQERKTYLAPRDEVSVEKNWNLETLLTAIISTIVREIEITHGSEIKKNRVFIAAKALSYRLSEAYNNFGVTAFSFGGSYGKTNVITQPSFIPATTLKHHLEDLAKLLVKIGYKNGVLVQLNNLDINAIHTEEHLEYLFNAARDYLQIANISWLLVGDIGLRSFISRKVDRLDDIISEGISIKPLTKTVYHELIQKRLKFYQSKKDVKFPLEKNTFDYLYDITNGRLRYIFGLIYSVLNRLQTGKLVQKISLQLAKDTILALAKERLQQYELTKFEYELLQILVKQGATNVNNLVKTTEKHQGFVSKTLSRLLEHKLVIVRPEGKQRIYAPSLSAKIAFMKN